MQWILEHARNHMLALQCRHMVLAPTFMKHAPNNLRLVIFVHICNLTLLLSSLSLSCSALPWSAVQMPEFPLQRCSVRPSGPYPTPQELQDYAAAYAQVRSLHGRLKCTNTCTNLGTSIWECIKTPQTTQCLYSVALACFARKTQKRGSLAQHSKCLQ